MCVVAATVRLVTAPCVLLSSRRSYCLRAVWQLCSSVENCSLLGDTGVVPVVAAWCHALLKANVRAPPMSDSTRELEASSSPLAHLSHASYVPLLFFYCHAWRVRVSFGFVVFT